MIEFSYKTPDILSIINADKQEITFDTQSREMFMGDFPVHHQGEFEK